MKRLFGLIGLLYLLTLTAVFYFKSPVLIGFALFAAFALIAAAVIMKIRRKRYMFKTLLISGVTIGFAVSAIFLYQNYYIDSIVNNYSDKEICVEGYVCEEITFNNNYAEYLIQTERINGNSVHTKIKFTGYSENDIKEFDRVTLNVKAFAEKSDRNISHRILLRAYEKSPGDITAGGESKPSLYKYAIMARKDMRKALGRLMTKDSASLSSAILLGDKNSLPDSVLNSFRKTGTSFLIVVSGLHLSVALALVSSVIKKFTKRRIPLCIGSIIVVICFAAVTGFNYSVIRAAIAVIIYQAGRIIFRNSDPLNSLGFAALAITIFNPCAVGDLGLLMSFSATMGIILWADKIGGFLTRKTYSNKIKNKKLKAAVMFFINLISVSISAGLWVLPIDVIAFGRITPLVVIISIITEPIAAIILALSLFCSLSYLFPVVPVLTQLVGYADDLLCRLLININQGFADLPISSVKAESELVYFWLGLTALLVIIGYIIKAKRDFVIASINISFALMLIFVPISYLTADTSSKITVYQSGNGVCLEVKKEGNISLLSAGGNSRYADTVYEEISSGNYEVDNIIIPDANYYLDILPYISEEFEVNNLLTNAESYEDVRLISEKNPYLIEENTIQTVKLNTDDEVTVICKNSKVYQYITTEGSSVIFVPRGGKVSDLPEEYKSADYAVLDSLGKDYIELNCANIIYTGNSSSYYNEKIENLESACESLTVLRNNKIEIK